MGLGWGLEVGLEKGQEEWRRRGRGTNSRVSEGYVSVGRLRSRMETSVRQVWVGLLEMTAADMERQAAARHTPAAGGSGGTVGGGAVRAAGGGRRGEGGCRLSESQLRRMLEVVVKGIEGGDGKGRGTGRRLCLEWLQMMVARRPDCVLPRSEGSDERRMDSHLVLARWIFDSLLGCVEGGDDAAAAAVVAGVMFGSILAKVPPPPLSLPLSLSLTHALSSLSPPHPLLHPFRWTTRRYGARCWGRCWIASAATRASMPRPLAVNQVVDRMVIRVV